MAAAAGLTAVCIGSTLLPAAEPPAATQRSAVTQQSAATSPAPIADTSAASQPATEPSAATWTQWRGPMRDGYAPATTFQWPASIKSLDTLWHVDLGDGYPSPIVSADRVFTVETIEGREVVRAFDRATGKPIWDYAWEGSMLVPVFAMKNGSWVRSTPAFDGKTLYVGGMRDVLVAIDTETGKARWRVDFVERYKTPLPSFGLVCSPLVKGDALFIQAGASFVRLDKNTGNEVWRALVDEGGMSGSAFSSPVLTTIAGREQLLVQTRKVLAGVDPETGKVLWESKVEAFQGMNVLTPTPTSDAGIFTSSYGGVSQLIHVEKKDDSLAADPSWTLRIEANMSSPVIIDGYAYLQRRDRRLSCINLETGKEAWTARPGFADYVSLVTDGQKILALDANGELFLFQHNPEKFDLLDQRKISDQQTWAHLIVCGDELFIREQRGLTAYRWKSSPTQQ